jgi:hypothetical protein
VNIPEECSFEFIEVTAIDCSRPFLAKRESLTGDAEDASSRSSSLHSFVLNVEHSRSLFQ